MDEAPIPQIFVRNAEGRVYGPLIPATVELLIEGGVLEGPLQISRDGVQYAPPFRFPDLRGFFPRPLWGGGDDEPARPSPVASPAAAPGRPSPPPPAVPARAPIPAAAPARPPAAPMPTIDPSPVARSSRASASGRSGEDPFAAFSPRQDAASVSRPTAAPVPAIPKLAEPRPGTRPAAVAADAPPPPAPPGPAGSPLPRVAPAGRSRDAEPPPPTPRSEPRVVTATAATARADLSEINAIRLYIQGGQTDVTGLFGFELSDRTISVSFRKGHPELVDSTHAEDAVDLFLESHRLVTPEQLTTARREKARYGGDVLGTLFAMGFANPAVVFPGLVQRAASLLLRALLATGGTFRFEAVELPANRLVPLGNRWALLAETLRKFPLRELKRRLLDVRARPVVRRGSGDALPDLGLSAVETRALGTFDGTRSLAMLGAAHPAEMEVILRVALLLRELDLVTFPEVDLAGRGPDADDGWSDPAEPSAPAPAPAPAPAVRRPVTTEGASSPPAARPPPAPPRPTSTAARTVVDFEAEIRDLGARLARLPSQNHFQLLGLTEKADTTAVKTAYFKLAKLFHPDTVPPGAPAELAKMKADFFAAVGEASRVLGDDASRAHYLESIKAGGGADLDVRRLLAAEETFTKGMSLVKAKRFSEALKALDEAIATNPREGEFYAWRGYARFFTLQDKKVAGVDALRDLNQALKLNERCAPAHYFIGQVHKLTGQNALALKHFKKCVQIDAQHVDAQREIRLLTGR